MSQRLIFSRNICIPTDPVCLRSSNYLFPAAGSYGTSPGARQRTTMRLLC